MTNSYLQGPLDGQSSLFETSSLRSESMTFGYRGPVACAVAGISYRQLDYWARTELVLPTIQTASGSGSQRLYAFTDILVLKVVKRLLDAGVSLQNIRAAVEHLRGRGVEDLTSITLMSDGSSVYECRSSEEVIDLVKGGQAVFGIAIGTVWQDVAGELAALPRAGDPVSAVFNIEDELSARRSKKATA